MFALNVTTPGQKILAVTEFSVVFHRSISSMDRRSPCVKMRLVTPLSSSLTDDDLI